MGLMAHAGRVMAVALVLTGCRTAVIRDVTGAPLPEHASASSEDIDEAIWRAGRKLGWSIESMSPGHLRGTLRVRRHVAVVSITHDGHRFNIHYEGSENLFQEGDHIHENYNVWVQRLAEKIQAESIVPMQHYEPGRSEQRQPMTGPS